jgi:hypothetical protein
MFRGALLESLDQYTRLPNIPNDVGLELTQMKYATHAPLSEEHIDLRFEGVVMDSVRVRLGLFEYIERGPLSAYCAKIRCQAAASFSYRNRPGVRHAFDSEKTLYGEVWALMDRAETFVPEDAKSFEFHWFDIKNGFDNP